MKTKLTVLLMLLVANCFAANPTFQSFNANQFSTSASANAVAVKDAARLTNSVLRGDTEFGNGGNSRLEAQGGLNIQSQTTYLPTNGSAKFAGGAATISTNGTFAGNGAGLTNVAALTATNAQIARYSTNLISGALVTNLIDFGTLTQTNSNGASLIISAPAADNLLITARDINDTASLTFSAGGNSGDITFGASAGNVIFNVDQNIQFSSGTGDMDIDTLNFNSGTVNITSTAWNFTGGSAFLWNLSVDDKIAIGDATHRIGSIFVKTISAATNIAPVAAATKSITLGSNFSNDTTARAQFMGQFIFTDAVASAPTLVISNMTANWVMTNAQPLGVVATTPVSILTPPCSPSDVLRAYDISGAGASIAFVKGWWIKQ